MSNKKTTFVDSFRRVINAIDPIANKGPVTDTKIVCDWARKACFEIDQLQAQLEQHKAEAKNPKEFARQIIETACWGICPPDGFDIQDLALELGLIEPHIATAEDINGDSDFEVGDRIYKFSKTLKAGE